MQVNNVQNSPNFGMAMYITKGAKPAMSMASVEELNKLRTYGESLKDGFDHIDVYVREGLSAVVKNRKTGKAVRGPFEAVFEPKDSTLKVIARNVEPVDDFNYAGKYVDTILNFKTKDAAKEAMNKLNKVDGLEAAVEYAKMAEESEKLLAKKHQLAEKNLENKNDLINDLFEHFGA